MITFKTLIYGHIQLNKSRLAPQFLPVPELMPFRLTHQFVSLMQPLKESGLIQSIMVHSLRAYRAEPDLLLNTMDVFVKEPSLDWKVKKQLRASKGFKILLYLILKNSFLHRTLR